MRTLRVSFPSSTLAKPALYLFLLLLTVSSHAQTSTVTLIWDANTETNLAGYKMYSGPASRIYTNSIDVGNVTTTTLSNLVSGMIYFFACTAYNTSGQESGFSNEVSYTPTNSVINANQPPTLDPISDVVINENAGSQNVTLTGISSGATNENQLLVVSAISDNPTLVPNPLVSYNSPNSTGTLTLAPAVNAFGIAHIAVTVNDGGTTNNLVSRAFTVTINWINQAPTLDPLTNLVLAANAGTQTINLTGITSGATNESQNLIVTALSSNPGIIPNPTISYTSPNVTGTLSFTPRPGTNGTVTITVAVNDGAAINNTFSRTFNVSITAPDTPPIISSITNQTLQKKLTSLTIPFTIGDAETAASNLVLSASSSNPALISSAQIVFGGNNSNRTVTLSPIRGQVGTSTLTINVSDGTLQASTSFLVTVVGNAPHIAYIAPPGSGLMILSMTLDDLTGTTVTWSSEPGGIYHLLARNNFSGTSWTDLSGPVLALATTTSWIDLTWPFNGTRLYWVMQEQ